MKIVVNHDWSYFELPDGFREKYNISYYLYLRPSEELAMHTDPRLIEYVENMTPEQMEDEDISLEVIEIPDNATDWQIHENDGWEDVIYVVDGKIHWSD